MLQHRYNLCLTVSLLFVTSLVACFQTSPLKEIELEYPLPPGELWSELTTWEVVPKEGSIVEIPEGKTVVLDVDTPELAGLMIKGTLVFAHGNIELTSDWIAVQGNLRIGSPDKPFTRQAIITLTGKPGTKTPLSSGMGNKVLAVQGGSLELYGQSKLSWTRLNKTAKAGDSELVLETEVDWQPGDHIVIASTDFDYAQAEERIVKFVEGHKVILELGSRGKDAHLKRRLNVEHWGEKETFDGHTLDERAEVGLLSRNILIRGDELSEEKGFGAHMMAMKGSTVHISGVEFHRMGQRGELARYPVHWHLAGEAVGNFIENSSIHRSYNRCITVHGTHGIRVEANVAYDAVGHCYFLEDGIERDNFFENNLGLVIRRPELGEELLPSEQKSLGPAVYWITNPDNTFRNNVAAGSEGSGFWFALPEHPTGPSSTETVWPRRTPLKEFTGNVSHSNKANGFHFDGGPNAQGEIETVRYAAHQNPSDENSDILETRLESFTSYKNRNRGAWIRGQEFILDRWTVADNAIGITLAFREVGVSHDYQNSRVQDSIFIGESANKGTPKPHEVKGEKGRSLPNPNICDEADSCAHLPIRGFEFYDGTVSVHDSYFAGYEPNKLRRAAALSYFRFTDFSVSARNHVRRLSFAPATNRVYLQTRPVPAQPEQGSEDGYRSALFLDVDGSVTGLGNSYVVVDNPFLHRDFCQKKSTWNTWVCLDEAYAALAIGTGSKGLSSVDIIRGDGLSHRLFGIGKTPNNAFRSILMANESYNLEFNSGLPQTLSLTLHEGSQTWLRLTLPYDGTTPFVKRFGKTLLPAPNLSQLDSAASSGYFFDSVSDTLHIKLVAKSERETLIISNPE